MLSKNHLGKKRRYLIERDSLSILVTARDRKFQKTSMAYRKRDVARKREREDDAGKKDSNYGGRTTRRRAPGGSVRVFFYEQSLRTTASPTDSLLPAIINVRNKNPKKKKEHTRSVTRIANKNMITAVARHMF